MNNLNPLSEIHTISGVLKNGGWAEVNGDSLVGGANLNTI